MANEKRRPNILFITCDQWRGDCLSAAGHPVVKTPHVDRLAAEGVLFRNHFAGAAPCSPARACIYTGLYQMNNRVCRNGTPMDARFDTLALAARRAGYDPTLFGYTDVAPDPRRLAPRDPLLRSYEGVLPGFTVRQLLPEHQRPWLSWLAGRGVDASAGFPAIHRPAGAAPGAVSRRPPVYSREETPGAFIAGEFIRWLGEQPADEPWFAHLSFISPHPPFVVPEPYNTLYDAGEGPAFRRRADWRDEAGAHPWLARELDRQEKRKFIVGASGAVRDWSEAEFRTVRALYWGMISETDAQLGRVFDAVRGAGQWDDTVAIFTSDHAEMMGDHFMLGKGGFFDQSYHLPLVVRDPRMGKRGLTIEAFTEAVDLMPTVVELIGGEAVPHLDGASLAPFLDGRTPAKWRDAAHWEYDYRSIEDAHEPQPFGLAPQQCNLAVLRTRTHKYVHFGGGLPPLLYDLRDDPGECADRAHDAACASARLEMAERLLAWRAEHLDQSLALVTLTERGPLAYGGARERAPR